MYFHAKILFLFVICIASVTIPAVDARKGGKGSKKSGKKSPKRSGKTSPKRRKNRDFLTFAEETLDEINNEICNTEGLDSICDSIADLVLAGDKYNVLPRYYYLNYLVMTIAYPIGPASLAEPNDDSYLGMTVRRALRIHRSLGRGNSLRLQGYPEDDVNAAYWDHFTLLELEDANIKPVGNGITTYCAYIAREYETLKDFALNNYSETFEFSTTFEAGRDNIESSYFYQLCMSPNLASSYLVRNDWEQHRSEVIGSMMKTENTERTVIHTLWHW
eukprot:CAMPEP_0183308256 /NCGR_PEP_ID=MMETSP0160_2-20130417/20800_1 /TAXON_ID=2839 ORGANISM="Odontella Sinensis, Strain Grunow 1884" /NCGR_SAMPLE_ID=MMETSP0160_2 /ASSEMBLY_ACC=CAM_ASM_000250 /LENGTH=274 /DNA_ID=CAMNT_0025472051 /DNA_START=167 /DNA_END=988 /DNA_ORIENTATION=-